MPSIQQSFRVGQKRSQWYHTKDHVDPQERMRKSELITCMTSYGILEAEQALSLMPIGLLSHCQFQSLVPELDKVIVGI